MFVLVALVALVLGVVVGWQIRFIASIPHLTALFTGFVAAVAWGLVLVIGLVGLAIMAFRRPTAGGRTLGVAGALAVGLLIGQVTGSEWRYPVEMGARVELHLDEPLQETFVATGTCRTIENGDRIVAVQASPIVRVGADRMSLFAWLARRDGVDHRIEQVGYHTEGRLAGYRSGPHTRLTVDTGDLQMSGSGTFTGLEAEPRGDQLGPGGPRSIDGQFSWSCEAPP